MELVELYPFNKLPETRREVDWDSRGVDGYGDVYLPDVFGNDSSTQMHDKDDVIEWVKTFISLYREEPLYREYEIKNTKFIKKRKEFIQGKLATLESWKKLI